MYHVNLIISKCPGLGSPNMNIPKTIKKANVQGIVTVRYSPACRDTNHLPLPSLMFLSTGYICDALDRSHYTIIQ